MQMVTGFLGKMDTLFEPFPLLGAWDVDSIDFEREGFWRRFLAVTIHILKKA